MHMSMNTPIARRSIRHRLAPQARKVLDIMERDGHITRLTGMHYGIANLTARIADLRTELERHGDTVICEERQDRAGNRYGRWSVTPDRAVA